MNGDTYNPELDRVKQRALIFGGAALALCVGGAFFQPARFFQAYLLGYLFWIGISLGCLAILMLHHMVGGSWGFVIQRILEAGTRTLPVMAALFLPLLAGLRYLYVWARPDDVAADALLRHKAAYLNVPFFLGRTAFYFIVWLALAYFLNRWSVEQDRTAEPGLTDRIQSLSAPGMVLYGLTVTFASIDWVMSLEPHWFSTVYGVMFMVGQALATMAFVVLAAARLSREKPLAGVIGPPHFHDLGNLMLAFVMLWAYISFSQFLIIWSGNLPEEIPWYLRRTSGGWQALAIVLVLFHFALPFVLLLNRSIKRRSEVLTKVAVAMLLMRLVDLFWVTVPALRGPGFQLHWMDLLAPLGIGGVWLASFLRQVMSRPLLPVNDPRWSAALGGAHAPARLEPGPAKD